MVAFAVVDIANFGERVVVGGLVFEAKIVGYVVGSVVVGVLAAQVDFVLAYSAGTVVGFDHDVVVEWVVEMPVVVLKPLIALLSLFSFSR